MPLADRRRDASTREPSGASRSLTERTVDLLIDAILDERFSANRLPTEPELAGMFSVSRTTIRAALQALERLGLISRSPGRGTVVLPHATRHTIALQRLVSFQALLEDMYGDVVVEDDLRLAPASRRAQGALGVLPDSTVLATTKRYVVDRRPAIYASAEIPLDAFDSDTRQLLEAGHEAFAPGASIFAIGQHLPGGAIHHTTVEPIPSIVDDAADSPLGQAPGEPFLTLVETHYDATGNAVATGRVLVNDRFLRLRIVRHL